MNRRLTMLLIAAMLTLASAQAQTAKVWPTTYPQWRCAETPEGKGCVYALTDKLACGAVKANPTAIANHPEAYEFGAFTNQSDPKAGALANDSTALSITEAKASVEKLCKAGPPAPVQAPATPPKAAEPSTLAELLATAPKAIGPAPAKYQTPFLVTSVSPSVNGEDCTLTIVTNGMGYSIGAASVVGRCSRLPSLRSLVWGRLGHRSLLGTDYVDLPGHGTFFITNAEAIGPDWGQ